MCVLDLFFRTLAVNSVSDFSLLASFDMYPAVFPGYPDDSLRVQVQAFLASFNVVVAFFSLARIFGECSTIYCLPALFFFFFEVEITLRTLIPLFMPGSVHSGSAG